MPNPGALRFNTDSLKMELFDGNQWVELVATSADSQTGGARGVFGGVMTPTTLNVISYVTISTTGNAIDFGDLLTPAGGVASASSTTRGVFAGGYVLSPATNNNIIQYITIASTGNALDFGDLNAGTHSATGVSNSTRAVFAGGYNYTPTRTIVNTINYITTASTGDSKDFGDLYVGKRGAGGIANGTRGVFASGSSGGVLNVIQFITISTLGNSSDFGDVTVSRTNSASSNAVRGVIFGGFAGSLVNTIDYITISTLGNATDFGDMTVARYNTTSCSSSTRAICAGDGFSAPTNGKIIEYVTIISTGNAVDFGDLTEFSESPSALSNAHGGL